MQALWLNAATTEFAAGTISRASRDCTPATIVPVLDRR